MGSHSRRSARYHSGSGPRVRPAEWSRPLTGDSVPVASVAPLGCRHKLVVSVGEQRLAMRIAATLLELIEPPADAVSTFEHPTQGTPVSGSVSSPSQAAAGWRVEAYFIEQPDPSAIAGLVGALIGAAPPEFALEAVPDENWVEVSQAALPPVMAGRFTVHGSHDRGRVARGPWTIEIDAGEAFGTAHHATTSGCLAAIDRMARRRTFADVLDLGCGTGVLAIAARRLMPRASVTASDIDAVASAVASANTRRNGTGSIRVVTADGVPRPGRRAAARFDLVIANILARPLVALAPAIAGVTARRGVLVLSGLLTSQAREVLGAYLARGFHLASHDRLAGWSTLTLIRR